MSKNNVVKLTGRDTITDPLTELLRTGAEQLIYQAAEAEFLERLAEHSERRTEGDKAGVVRNGHLPERELRKLPRQVDHSKVEDLALFNASAGVIPPRLSWSRSSLYSSIHAHVISRTSSRSRNSQVSSTSVTGITPAISFT
jgi:hypothetical protein